MKPTISMRDALADPNPALPGTCWVAWRTMLIALTGEPLTDAEREIFRKFTKRDVPPAERVREAWFVIGRRGGKSRAIAVLTVYLACLCKHEKLVKGETGVALVIAPDKKQARVILEYANSIIEDSAMLRQTVVKRSGVTIEGAHQDRGALIEFPSHSWPDGDSGFGG